MEGGTERHTFRCRHCRYRASVEITVRSMSDLLVYGVEPQLVVPGRTVDAESGQEIDRTLAVARCPRCGQRDRAAVTRLWLSAVGSGVVVVAAFGGALAVLVLLAHRHDPSEPIARQLAWIGGGVVLAVAALVTLAQRPRWQVLDRRVRWLESSEERGDYRSIR